MPGEDGLGSIELFRKHRPDQKVGPGHGPKREYEPGRVTNSGRMPVGPADQEGEVLYRVVAPPLQLLRQIGAGQRLAALVQGDDDGTRRDGRKQQSALFLRKPFGGNGLAGDNFAQRDLRLEARRIGIEERAGRVASGAPHRGKP